MNFVELLLVAAAASMDVFAVSISSGLCMPRATWKNMLTFGCWFGAFQALMPLLGYALASAFAEHIIAWDHWIALVLLGLLGANMIRESLGKKKADCSVCTSYGAAKMLPLAIATSVDALVMGVSFAFLQVNIWLAVSFIGMISFLAGMAGVKIGNAFGARLKSYSEIIGGVILILIGLKIFIEHVFF